jgi:hypothetical protein
LRQFSQTLTAWGGIGNCRDRSRLKLESRGGSDRILRDRAELKLESRGGSDRNRAELGLESRVTYNAMNNHQK